jgi:hypothetical protein
MLFLFEIKIYPDQCENGEKSVDWIDYPVHSAHWLHNRLHLYV